MVNMMKTKIYYVSEMYNQHSVKSLNPNNP